jgi:aspartoacylase
MVAVQVQVLKALPVATSYDYPAPVIKRVVVVGGTHGNEYTGVWCIKAMAHQSQDLKTKYPSLDISTLLANPQAHLKTNDSFKRISTVNSQRINSWAQKDCPIPLNPCEPVN